MGRALKIPNLGSKDFNENKYEHFEWLRENEPVYKGKFFVLNGFFLSRYQDCADMLRDDRFVRNRSTATGGGSRFPIPMPKSLNALVISMITEDNPGHRRLRLLVNKAFTPRSLQSMESQLIRLTDDLLDRMEENARPGSVIDLVPAYSLPIPVKVISMLMGVSDDDMPRFRNGLRVLTEGMSGWKIIRTMFRDLPNTIAFTKELIAIKKLAPGEDILSGLIQAEQDGEKLSEDELISMVFLLIFAGYETTVHLINNGVLSLLQHPAEMDKLRSNPDLGATAVEEMLRFRGPIQSSKQNYATEDVKLQGIRIPKGSMVMPLLGAANRDPRFFDNPEQFDITRTPNKHLGFGYGIHLCLGAWLARLETKVAVNQLLARFPNLALGVDEKELKLQRVSFWHRYESLPVRI